MRKDGVLRGLPKHFDLNSKLILTFFLEKAVEKEELM